MGWKLDEEVLLARAARGDRAAAGAYLAQQLPALQRSARRIAGSRMDPDDLLADAIEGLLARWADGGAEIAAPRSYLLASMRNRVINETRAPRSRSTSLDPEAEFEDPSAPATDATVELDHELAWLRLALGKLSEAHRGVLREDADPGAVPPSERGSDERSPGERSPGERSADARQSLRARARRALRRAYLQVVLEEGAPPACHSAISRLPSRVGDSPESTPDAPEHFRGCSRCRNRWLVFASLAGGLGIAGIAIAPAGNPAAHADGLVDPGALPGGTADSEASKELSAAGGRTRSGRRVAPQRVIASGVAVAGIGILLALAAVLPQLPRPWAGGGTLDPGRGSTEAVGPGAGTALGAGIAARMGFAVTGGPVAGDGIQEVTIRLTFDVAGSDWSTHELDFDLPSAFDAVSASGGWSCEGRRCAPATADAREGVFSIRGVRGAVEERIGVRWRAEASGRSVAADASSSVPPAGETYSTSASDRSG